MRTQFDPLCLDAPGHGLRPDGKRSLPDCADDIASQMTPGILVGYSMGARMALHVALQHPSVVSHLVLISGTPGLKTEKERSDRRTSDNTLADHLEDIGVERFIDEWLALPIFAGLTDQTNQRTDRLRNTAAGLADSLRYAGSGTQESLWGQLAHLQMPVHLVVGEADTKFCDIARDMTPFIANVQLTVVPHVGHTVHLENPLVTARLLDDAVSHGQ